VLEGISRPNVVAVLDYVEDQRGAWLITEYVHGASLAAVLARAGTLAPGQALGVLSGALSGLEHVHAKRVSYTRAGAVYGGLAIAAAGRRDGLRPSLDGVLLFGAVSGTCGVTPTLLADTWLYGAEQAPTSTR